MVRARLLLAGRPLARRRRLTDPANRRLTPGSSRSSRRDARRARLVVAPQAGDFALGLGRATQEPVLHVVRGRLWLGLVVVVRGGGQAAREEGQARGRDDGQAVGAQAQRPTACCCCCCCRCRLIGSWDRQARVGLDGDGFDVQGAGGDEGRCRSACARCRSEQGQGHRRRRCCCRRRRAAEAQAQVQHEEEGRRGQRERVGDAAAGSGGGLEGQGRQGQGQGCRCAAAPSAAASRRCVPALLWTRSGGMEGLTMLPTLPSPR